MDKIKAVVNDPAKLQEELKKAFEKMDAEKKGYISHEVLKTALIEQAKALGLPKPEKEPTEEEKAAARKIADPDGSGKITFENFVKLMEAGIKKAREMGKI
jgi:Ca2+-binding EF-hand superfamily protein